MYIYNKQISTQIMKIHIHASIQNPRGLNIVSVIIIPESTELKFEFQLSKLLNTCTEIYEFPGIFTAVEMSASQ